MALNLNIGGTQPHPNWQILNVNPGPSVAFVGNAIDLSRFSDGEVDQIYASHILEHFSYRHEMEQVVTEWYRVLKPGGRLLVSVPNLAVLTQLFVSEQASPKDKFQIMTMIMGGQADDYDYHKVAFYPELLIAFLTRAGFDRVEFVDRFGLFSDTSDLEVMGELISLNAVAYRDS
jgi:predicted SAM-dependent methyltransferase